MTELNEDAAGILRRARAVWRGSEKTRFLVVGAWNTAFGYLAFIALYFLLYRVLHYLFIMVIAHFISVCNAFLGHKYVVFRSGGKPVGEFFRFNLSYGGTIIFGLIAMPIMVELLQLHPIAAQGILTIITVILSYVLHKSISFRQRP